MTILFTFKSYCFLLMQTPILSWKNYLLSCYYVLEAVVSSGSIVVTKVLKHPYCNNKAGLPRWLVVKNPPANAGDIRDAGLIPGLERSPEYEGMETH